jgi:thiamine pyrophosphokinase
MEFSKYLIVANGPFLSKAIILEAAENAFIIALDGASNKLFKLGIKPNIILGDFDSFQGKVDFFSDVKRLIIPDQNFTDLQKGLKFAKKYASEIHIVCATGGRMDHEQSNIRSLQSEYSIHCPIYLHNECQTMTFASNQTILIAGKHHDYCGLFGMPEAVMLVKNAGLGYGGEKPYVLSSSSFSVSNRLIGDDGAIVEITGDALIVNPPMLMAQRKMAKKNREYS